MHNHIKVLAILFIAVGVIGAFMGLVFMALMLVGPIAEGDPKAFLIVGGIGSILASLIMVTTIPGIFVGYGLLKRRNWARVVGIIFAIFSMIDFPVGTAIGIYALWVLLKPETVLLFSHGPGYQPTPSENPA
jgi:hypothetical protein